MTRTLESISQVAAWDALLAEHLVVAHFWASWATPCEQMTEVMQALVRVHDQPKVCFVQVEAEQVPDLAERYEIVAVPTVLLLLNAKEVARVDGADAAQLTTVVEQHIKRMQLLASAPVIASACSNGARLSDDAEMWRSLEQRLLQLIRQSPIMAFIKGTKEQPRCGFTRQLVQLLNSRNVSYETFDILTDNDVREGLKRLSDWPTYPQIYVNGQLLGGLDIVKQMAADGSLDSALSV